MLLMDCDEIEMDRDFWDQSSTMLHTKLLT